MRLTRHIFSILNILAYVAVVLLTDGATTWLLFGVLLVSNVAAHAESRLDTLYGRGKWG